MKKDSRIIIGALVIVFVLALGYSTVSDYLVKYKTVSEVVQGELKDSTWINGTILKGSFNSLNTGEYTFIITDGVTMLNVSFTGELPSSLGTDSDIVMLGTMRNSTFHATKMITRCPTKYQG